LETAGAIGDIRIRNGRLEVLSGFTPYITTKNGRRIYARKYGKRVFPIWKKRV